MSTPAPELKEWGEAHRNGDTVVLLASKDNPYGTSATLYRNTNIWTLASGIPFNKLRALIDEAEQVGRHYWGDEWGREK